MFVQVSSRSGLRIILDLTTLFLVQLAHQAILVLVALLPVQPAALAVFNPQRDNPLAPCAP